jgi:hypothetical protein
MDQEELPVWFRRTIAAGIVFLALFFASLFLMLLVSLGADLYGEVYERFYCEGGIRCQKNHKPVRIDYRNTDDASVPPAVAEAHQ